MKRQLTILLTIMFCSSYAHAQDDLLPQTQAYIRSFENQYPIPSGYELQSINKVEVDKQSAYLFRYVTADNQGLLGEHFSFIMDEKSKEILGFMHAAKKYTDAKMLSKVETEVIAKRFLEKVDPQLAADLENLWIAQHDESIMIAPKTTLLISGMKYKCYRAAKNDYSWVIVGADGSILCYERNIKWDMAAQKRITEKWLHDNWILEMGYANRFK